MPSLRLLPWQTGSGATLDGTRLESMLLELMRLYDDVPPNLVQRRWSQSNLIAGFSPAGFVGPSDFIQSPAGPDMPFMYNKNSLTIPPGITNTYRAKSVAFPTFNDVQYKGAAKTWETSFVLSRPCIVGRLTLRAGTMELDKGSNYTNTWQYDNTHGAAIPPGYASGDPTADYTLQLCISDGWDLENRAKLRQELLLYHTPSTAVAFSRAGNRGLNTSAWPLTAENFGGFSVKTSGLVLVPAGARIFAQWTVPEYNPHWGTTWNRWQAVPGGYIVSPTRGNVWNLSQQIWMPTR